MGADSNLYKMLRRAGYFFLSPPGSFPYRTYFVKRKSVFIHIPKCGGTSVLRAYSGNYCRDHATWYEFHRSNPVRWKDYYKFTFVRNPWSRLVSVYRYMLNRGNGGSDLAFANEMRGIRGGFSEFVNLLYDDESWLSDRMFWPQTMFTHSRDGFMLDDYLKIEDLSRFPLIASRAKLSISNLPRLNKSGDKVDFRSFYSSKSVDQVREIYRSDVKAFGYYFDE